MKDKEVIDLAIKRHDIDASWFQNVYDPANTNANPPFLYGRKLVLEELDEVLKTLPAGAKILDMGSGTGHLTKALKDKGFNVFGVEPSEDMLGFARKNFPDIEFKKGISTEIPFEDGEFDMIVAFEVLRYLNKQVNAKTYQEFFRVLKPGGQFFVTHVNKYSSDYYFFFYFIKGILYKIRKTTYHYCYFTTPGKEENLCKAAGFGSAQTVGRMDGQLRIAYKFGKWCFNIQRRSSEFIWGKQRFKSNPLKALAGHLILIAKK